MKLVAILTTLALAVAAASARADETQTTPAASAAESPAAVVTLRMKDGSSLRARIVDQDGERYRIVTVGGLAMDVPRDAVADIDADEAGDGARPSDSNYTRLLFSPTGRPLGKGEGYFSDHYVVFPGFAYGLTDNLSIGAGMLVVPGLGLDEQVFFVAPRLGKQFSDRFALSAGVLFAHAGGEDWSDDENLGVGFAMATVGRPDRSLTLGLGVARTVEQYETYRMVNGRYLSESHREVSHTPVVVVGGTARLSRHLAFVSENWLVLHDDFRLSEQPFALGLRFLGDRLSADVGVILVGELIDEGFPVPWLSVTYHFGPKRSVAASRPRNERRRDE
ncbi:MAG: hypothetical protein K1Y01_02590 [Vicinamibacteria bacterium]|nr:hypothetical protein [Vicinamibacteria bacterium]